jgi:hypothetical protein
MFIKYILLSLILRLLRIYILIFKRYEKDIVFNYHD